MHNSDFILIFIKVLLLVSQESACSYLSYDRDKNCSTFYCTVAIRFSHIETVDYFQTENLSTDGKQFYEIKCILTPF